jgi:hypothetical protein
LKEPKHPYTEKFALKILLSGSSQEYLLAARSDIEKIKWLKSFDQIREDAQSSVQERIEIE